ncbi:MAG TPA: pilus assembly protein TadG-related protein [Clostridia bacterium]|nr:pilus assembly protein TadG-related protein [Clostridia bacterium]
MNINNEKGSVTILFVLIITIIIGFVGLAVDFGHAVLEDVKLSNAIDAATLAAAQDLDDVSKATLTAQEYLHKNNVNPNDVTITFSDSNHSIRLESNGTVDNRFMKLLGINTTGIGASAKATINPITKVSGGIKPFGVEYFDVKDASNFGKQFTLKAGASSDEDYGPGNFGALALGGTGASNLRYNALNGYSGPIEIGQEIETEPGNMASIINPIKQMLSSDATKFEDYSATSMPEDSIRMWVVPMVDSFDVNGRSYVKVVGFAMFFVEDIGKQSGKTNIKGRFVKGIIPGEMGETQQDLGLYAAKLVE